MNFSKMLMAVMALLVVVSPADAKFRLRIPSAVPLE